MVRILLPKNLRSRQGQALLRHLAVLSMAFVSSAAFAQSAGIIQATVLDDTGIEMPGVKVIVAGETGTMGGEQAKMTDDLGQVRFTELLPGTYVLTATKDGFKTASVTGVQVIVNRTQVVTVTMESGGAVEVIEVVDKQQVVDTQSVTRGEVLTKDFLQKIPAGRSYQSAVTMAAGVVDSGNGNPNMGGGAYNENTYMLDGATVTDPVTGTFSMNFNFDAIQSIEVLLGGYEPEYGTSLGGVVNVVTESGTNNLQFNTSLFYENGNWGPKRDARYTADGYPLAPTGFDSTFQSYTFNAKVSGPVVRDKAWFLLSYSNPRTLFSNVGVDLPRDFDGHYVFGKFTLQPSSDHRVTATMQSNPTTIDNTEQGLRIRPEAQGRQVQGGALGVGRWQWFLSPTATLDTSITYQKSFIEVNGVPCTHNRDIGYSPCKPGEEENTVDWETPGHIGIGGAYDSVNYYSFYFDDRYRYEASTKLAVLGVKDPLGGKHDLKFGAGANQTVWDQIQGTNGNAYYYDINQQAYDPRSIMSYYWVETSGPTKFRTTGSQWNAFAQDAWQPHPNLTLKYGSRIDSSVMRNDLNEPVIDITRFGPRLGFAWDPLGDGKTKFAGGVFRFNDTGRLSVASFSSETSGYGYKLFVGPLFVNPENGDGFLGNPATMYDGNQAGNLNTVAGNLRTPHSDEYLLMMQREIIEDIGVEITATRKHTGELFEYDEVNVNYDEDGSSVIGARNGNSLRNIYRLRTPTLAQRDYTQFDLSLYKIESRRWAASATYTYALSTGTSREAMTGSFANDPQTQYNNGPLIDSDIRHQLKSWAFWDLPTDPWKQTLGARVIYNSGYAFERWYYDEESFGYGLRIRDRATYGRLPGWWDVSVTFQQDLDVKKGKVTLIGTVNNVLNLQAPQWADTYYLAAEHRMIMSYRQQPLSAELGVRYAF
jgi:hypothetical protein